MPSPSNARPIPIERSDGSSLRTASGPERAGSATAWAVPRLRAATRSISPRCGISLQRRKLERPEKADLMLENDAESVMDAPAGLVHQRDRLGRGRLARVL